MGSIDSAKAEEMIAAAEEILREEGYAALTSRKIAEYLGVKQRLVYYYFHTMDDLILETFKRSAARDMEKLKNAISADRPLIEIFEVCINTADARLISEYMALANRNEDIRAEVIAFIEETRKIQVNALKQTLAKSGNPGDVLSAEAIAFMGTSIALAMHRETALGVTRGHTAVKKSIKQFFDSIESSGA